MKKKEFLSILEEKLEVLNKDEREDILNEYKDTISEKVKNGQTEEEAIKDFGDIDDLARELLDAYKINPEYSDKSILEEGEHLVKRGADKLASATKDLYHRFENCYCQYKNAGFWQYKRVGKPTFLYWYFYFSFLPEVSKITSFIR